LGSAESHVMDADVRPPQGAGASQRHRICASYMNAPATTFDPTLAYEAFDLPADAGLVLVTYSPEPGSPSEKAPKTEFDPRETRGRRFRGEILRWFLPPNRKLRRRDYSGALNLREPTGCSGALILPQEMKASRHLPPPTAVTLVDAPERASNEYARRRIHTRSTSIPRQPCGRAARRDTHVSGSPGPG
jgi:hypothetical protein